MEVEEENKRRLNSVFRFLVCKDRNTTVILPVFWYGCGTRCVTLNVEHRLIVLSRSGRKETEESGDIG